VRICLTNSFGKENGIYKSYYDNGQLEAEVNYIDGLRQGIYKLYHSNGQLWNEVNYIDGKKV
jgi:antitoxin component YwqK of YwqJK toxin-antitoxin module